MSILSISLSILSIYNATFFCYNVFEIKTL